MHKSDQEVTLIWQVDSCGSWTCDADRGTCCRRFPNLFHFRCHSYGYVLAELTVRFRATYPDLHARASLCSLCGPDDIARPRAESSRARGETPRGSRLSGGRHTARSSQPYRSIRRSKSASQATCGPNKIPAAARELHAHGAKGAEDHDLRGQQYRIRQQARLPITDWRQKRREARDHEKLSQHPQGKETEQDPKQCRHSISLSGHGFLLSLRWCPASARTVVGMRRAESGTSGARRV